MRFFSTDDIIEDALDRPLREVERHVKHIVKNVVFCGTYSSGFYFKDSTFKNVYYNVYSSDFRQLYEDIITVNGYRAIRYYKRLSKAGIKEGRRFPPYPDYLSYKIMTAREMEALSLVAWPVDITPEKR